MKRRLLLALVGLAIGFAAPVFAEQTGTPDPQARQRLAELLKNFVEAYNRNDAAAAAANFTEDAVLVTPYGPISGQQAIGQWYADLFKEEVHLSNLLGTVDPDSPHFLGTDGNAMWATGKWGVAVQGQSGTTEVKGYWSAIGVRQGEEWKVRMLCLNNALAPAATPAPTATPSGQ